MDYSLSVCTLIITLITRILDTFMFGLNMSLKNTVLFSFLITLITRIFDIFIGGNVICQGLLGKIVSLLMRLSTIKKCPHML